MTVHAPGAATPVDAELIESYAALGATVNARRQRRGVARRFTANYDSIESWRQLTAADRLAAPVVLRSYAAWAVVVLGWAVDPDYVVGTPTNWAGHVGERDPIARAELATVATDLGFKPLEIRRMWAAMAKLSVISGVPSGAIADGVFTAARDNYLAAVERRCGRIPNIFATPVFALNVSCSISAEDPPRSDGPGKVTAEATGSASRPRHPNWQRRCAVISTRSPCRCGPGASRRSTPPCGFSPSS